MEEFFHNARVVLFTVLNLDFHEVPKLLFLFFSEVQPRRQVLEAAYCHQEKIWSSVDATTSCSLLGKEWKYYDIEDLYPPFFPIHLC